MVWRVVALLALAGCRLHFTEAEPSDGATADGTSDAYDLCAQPTTLLCEDFATAPTGTTSGDVQWLATGGRTGGMFEAHGLADPGARLNFDQPLASSGLLAVRSYVRVKTGAPITMFAVVLEINNALVTNGQEKISVDLGDMDRWEVAAPYSGGGPTSPFVVERDRWTCVELRTVIDAVNGEMHLLIDGVEIATSTGDDTAIPGGYQRLVLSALPSNSDPEITVDFDDVVVALAPIGC